MFHPHKKGVKAEQVFDFLPDPETWATDYQIVRFIDHPAASSTVFPSPTLVSMLLSSVQSTLQMESNVSPTTSLPVRRSLKTPRLP